MKSKRAKRVGWVTLLKETFKEWNEDYAPRLGAALAYYTIFSVGPLILIAITVAGAFFDNAQQEVLGQIRSLVGTDGEKMISEMIQAQRKPAEATLATAVGIGTLFFGAAGVFIQLKSALNTIWDVENLPSGGVWGFIRKYLLSFSMVLGVGFLLLVSLMLSAFLALVGNLLGRYMEGMDVIMKILGFAFSFGVITLLFAVLFKYLPDVKVAWRDVWVGALMTAFLFVVGKFGLGYYLGNAKISQAYGAAGSLVVMVLWIYYSAQILFFGAEFTQVYAKYRGTKFKPENVVKPPKEPKSRLEKLVAASNRQREKLTYQWNQVASGRYLSRP